jgi:organic hydroperoxide reductase OsmC/OhrA
MGQSKDISPVPVNGCPTSPLAVSNGKITICHATGSQTNPYNEITVSVNGLNGHGTHADDIIPAPASGCPASVLVISNSKITICHATGSQTHPYNEITVSINGLNGHGNHPDDIIPAPASGCPTTKP